MEAEIADLLDRRMMSLFAVAKKTIDKGDVQNMSEAMRCAKYNGENPYGYEMSHRIAKEGIPELGLCKNAKDKESEDSEEEEKKG